MLHGDMWVLPCVYPDSTHLAHSRCVNRCTFPHSLVISLRKSQKFIGLQNKVTEKFKRPLKKRHSSVYHQPTNRVNKYLAQAIDARSVHREKATHVHLLTLCFKDTEKEAQVTYPKAK
ncbi:hypothetical protein EVAR_66059_1 [Eumeta japonica]|uniref:Adenylate cyclase conserved domain-containing protein n=1 Tax=Eumeta variegata TaxID=151549 RepID=A0A4C1ZLC9_EUMVA|nr:hypothetical protein EVAR_66059_1 [Eumeta japonica]